MCKPEECIGHDGQPRWCNLALPHLQAPDNWVPRPRTPKKRKMGRQDATDTSDEDNDDNEEGKSNKDDHKDVNEELESPPLAQAPAATKAAADAAVAAATPEAAAAATSGGSGRAHGTEAQACVGNSHA